MTDGGMTEDEKERSWRREDEDEEEEEEKRFKDRRYCLRDDFFNIGDITFLFFLDEVIL